MWRILLLLTIVFVVEGKRLENKMGIVSDQCVAAMATCSQGRLGRDGCRSVYNSLMLQMIRSDMNNDCKVDDKDFENYLEVDFDTNNDDSVCQNEWIAYMTSYLGFTTETAVGIFQMKFKNKIKDNCVDIEEVSKVDDMKLKTKYINSLMEDLASFCSMDKIMDTNRDCWGLVSLCKGMAKTMMACKKLDVTNKKTLYEKFVLEHQTSDQDNDGMVTSDDANRDLQNNYDSDRNGCITEREWVDRWTSFYHFTPEFARSYYVTIDTNGDKCIYIGDFNFPPKGMSQMTRIAIYMKHLIGLCEANKRLYADMDCASLGDTCRMHFHTLPECTKFLNNCGLEKYSDCVNQETNTGGSCVSEADKFEVKFENLKINNQINNTCVAYNMNAANIPSASPVFLLSLVLFITIFFQS